MAFDSQNIVDVVARGCLGRLARWGGCLDLAARDALGWQFGRVQQGRDRGGVDSFLSLSCVSRLGSEDSVDCAG